MSVLGTSGVGANELRGLLALASRAYAYCTRACGKWGSPSCYSCMFRGVRKLHGKLEKTKCKTTTAEAEKEKQ